MDTQTNANIFNKWVSYYTTSAGNPPINQAKAEVYKEMFHDVEPELLEQAFKHWAMTSDRGQWWPQANELLASLRHAQQTGGSGSSTAGRQLDDTQYGMTLPPEFRYDASAWSGYIRKLYSGEPLLLEIYLKEGYPSMVSERTVRTGVGHVFNADETRKFLARMEATKEYLGFLDDAKEVESDQDV